MNQNMPQKQPNKGGDYLIALAAATLCTAAGYSLRGFFSEVDIIMIYLMGAVIAAARLGRWPALLYSAVSVSAFNFFFISPVFTFNVDTPSYWLTLVVMFFACLVISSQAARLREQMLLSRQREEETKRFYEIRQHNILLSSVSHDLRSPLAAIAGAADALLQTRGDNDAPDGRDLLLSIRGEAGRLTRIINNLLDITHIEGGQIELNMQAYDPAEIIGSAAAACGETLKAHRLVLQVAEGLPFVKMDGLLISQLIQNLLENAAHHTPPGTCVTLDARLHGGGLRITVSDTGPGIPAGRERDIFSKFSTFGLGDRPKGAGLGLSICQAIATLHQGRIQAENGPEGGCRITVDLPASLILAESAAA